MFTNIFKNPQCLGATADYFLFIVFSTEETTDVDKVAYKREAKEDEVAQA